MTEAEFLASDGPRAVLRHLEGVGRLSNRKLRLFAAACARVRCAGDAGALAEIEADEAGYDSDPMPDLSRRVAEYAFDVRNLHFAPDVSARFAALLRCVFGNPFRPVRVSLSDGERPVDLSGNCALLPRCCLEWRDGTVPKIAREIYDERAFDRLPVLADALEEGGCAVPEVLTHCRREGEVVRGWYVCNRCGRESECPPGAGTFCRHCRSEFVRKKRAAPHARGCFVLDLILGQE